MLFLLSPAKSLDYDTPLPEGLPHTTPPFVAQSTALIAVLREQSPQQIASLMALSDKLAALNVARYQAWTPSFTPANRPPPPSTATPPPPPRCPRAGCVGQA